METTIHLQHVQESERSLSEAFAAPADEVAYWIGKAQTHALLALYWLKAGDPLPMMPTSTPPGTRDS